MVVGRRGLGLGAALLASRVYHESTRAAAAWSLPLTLPRAADGAEPPSRRHAPKTDDVYDQLRDDAARLALPDAEARRLRLVEELEDARLDECRQRRGADAYEQCFFFGSSSAYGEPRRASLPTW